mgnify:CR=1 FL=1
MITAVDIENTFSNGDNMPYSGENTLVSCGYLTNTGEQDYLCFYHAEQPPTKNNVVVLQSILDKTTLLVGHNIKYDLLWLQAWVHRVKDARFLKKSLIYLMGLLNQEKG